MPNIAPRGLFGRVAGAEGPASAASQVFATLPGETVPREAVEVWCGDETGVPRLVYASAAGAPTSVVATYSGGAVTVSWTQAAAADGYVVKRADGSIVGTVAGGSIVDTAPRALTGAYTVTGTLQALVSTPAASSSLDLREDPTVAAAYGAGVVVLGWAHPSIGQPAVGYRIERNGVTVATVGPTITTWTDTNPPVGTVPAYGVVPLFHDSTTGVAGTDTVSVPAAAPASVTLVASGSNNLRIAWAHPSGSRTGYEVERYASSWAAHATPGSSVTSSDWSTTAPGSMRVRTLSAGGASAWVELGPVTPVAATAPGLATITSWKPEASYGRYVVRATMPSDANVTAWRALAAYNDLGAPFVDGTGWISTTPGATVNAVALTMGNYNSTVKVKVEVRNSTGQVSQTAEVTYSHAASPILIPATDSGTYASGAWRNDAERNATALATGGEPWVPRDNKGVFLYGTTIATALAGKTVLSMTIEYARESTVGGNYAIQPIFLLHDRATKSGAPLMDDGGQNTLQRSGTGVAKSGTTAARWTLPSSFVTALQLGSWKGILMWSDALSYAQNNAGFMHLYAAGSTPVGSPAVKPGLLQATHLG